MTRVTGQEPTFEEATNLIEELTNVEENIQAKKESIMINREVNSNNKDGKSVQKILSSGSDPVARPFLFVKKRGQEH